MWRKKSVENYLNPFRIIMTAAATRRALPAKGAQNYTDCRICRKKTIIFEWMTPKIINRWYSHTKKGTNGETMRKSKKQMRMAVCVCVSLKFIKLEHSFFTVDGDWSALETAPPFPFWYRFRFGIFLWVVNNRMIHSGVSHFHLI